MLYSLPNTLCTKADIEDIAPDLAQVKRTESGFLDHGTKGIIVFNPFHSKLQA